ncbi:hypothetical protein, partial [Mesorhizobium argentiipisi]
MAELFRFGVVLFQFFLLPLWDKVSPKATDEGCSRKRRRLTPLDHPSSVSALSRRSTFSRKEGFAQNRIGDSMRISGEEGFAMVDRVLGQLSLADGFAASDET